jgi:hypothetical protein
MNKYTQFKFKWVLCSDSYCLIRVKMRARQNPNLPAKIRARQNLNLPAKIRSRQNLNAILCLTSFRPQGSTIGHFEGQKRYQPFSLQVQVRNCWSVGQERSVWSPRCQSSKNFFLRRQSSGQISLKGLSREWGKWFGTVDLLVLTSLDHLLLLP